MAFIALVLIKSGSSKISDEILTASESHPPSTGNATELSKNSTGSVAPAPTAASTGSRQVTPNQDKPKWEPPMPSSYYRIMRIAVSPNTNLENLIKIMEKKTLSIRDTPNEIIKNTIRESKFDSGIQNVVIREPNKKEFVVKMTIIENSNNKDRSNLFLNFKSAANFNGSPAKVLKYISAIPIKNDLLAYDYSKISKCTSKYMKKIGKKAPEGNALPIKFMLDYFGSILNQCEQKEGGEEKSSGDGQESKDKSMQSREEMNKIKLEW